MGRHSLHAGYARYFTPPPLEAVPQSTISKFTRTTNESAITKDSPISAERAHYFDAGVTQKIMEGWNVGLDGFYKSSHSTLDEGQFGQALILSSFNYKRGRIYGGEFTTNYDHGPFSALRQRGMGLGARRPLEFGAISVRPCEYAFVKKHWIFLDHDQRCDRIAGGPTPGKTGNCPPIFSTAADCGAALPTPRAFPITERSTFASADLKIPNMPGSFKIRFDVVNLFDEVYELRDGSGIGVGAPQFGQRRGFYGTVAYDF